MADTTGETAAKIQRPSDVFMAYAKPLLEDKTVTLVEPQDNGGVKLHLVDQESGEHSWVGFSAQTFNEEPVLTIHMPREVVDLVTET